MPAKPQYSDAKSIGKSACSIPTPHEVILASGAWPTVLLRHELPDSSHHIDWMLGRDRDGQLPLTTFRLPAALDSLAERESMPAEKIDDHRPAYLTYEGPVSGDRGTVRQVGAGIIENWTQLRSGNLEQWELDIRWNQPESGILVQGIRVQQLASCQWMVICLFNRRSDRQP